MDQEKNSSKDKSQSKWFGKRDLVEWGVILALGVVLYATGWHTEVAGRLQQVVLWTGLIQPETELPKSEQVPAGLNMDLLSFEGEPVSLAAFKGKVIFLNYWATWCPPCIAEMPNIQSLYEEYKDSQKIAFVMVSVDEDAEKAEAFIARKEFTFPVYHLAGPRPGSLQSTVLPTTFVINRQGKIVAKKSGMASYNTSQFKSFLEKIMH
ncbi:TlpA family protein disulfide reductase [Aliifodinibius sp. S!AR15-10]|uniref:TlpA family protein disulfide reductase n=1 Tax=Aliifodinibius sp. S!AR15-10 TaxID=2950437 RepID=UPI00285EDC13|nr:TlpA disulfide reductase family protein [Aliifodinibius sp. S!AR15-10]MDR8393150.1 TlpA family protein disulfide reductase [Aliifodinibius sp. S!AR15-10]